ncbi:hypothetical protein CDD83_10483 [Cordyceps sp. RAO-2017]|nr:hypothetical protein CDD83_10483 [Cordyceps sp. RAO-2017]
MDLRTDVQIVLKLGIDAQITYKKEFTTDLIDYGLPALSFGVVVIGPRISVQSRVEFEAAATGKLLAGAEMGLQDSHIRLDLVNRGESRKSGWEPYFKPAFEADGELMLSASLGLPVGLKCGIKFSKWDISAGVVNEPSIKAVAQVAASVGQTDKGLFATAFKETNGCTGISTQISWRNRMWIHGFGSRQSPLFDTNDRKLTRSCIAPPSKSSGSQTSALSQTGSLSSLTPEDLTALQRRQDDEFSSDEVIELTSEIQGNSSLLYDLEPEGNEDYNEITNIQFTLLMDADGSTMVISCSNGNFYAVHTDDQTDNPECSEMWAMNHYEVVLSDGTGRVMYYYRDAMIRTGVSRFRVTHDEEIPLKTEVVVLVPFQVDPETESPDDFYLAMDMDGNIFYPVVCNYPDSGNFKVFLAEDLDEGIEMLKSEDVKYSITGGDVSECYPLALLPDYDQ